MGVMEALKFPPGMQAFLTNNLSWLLRPNEVSDLRYPPRKRGRAGTSEDESNDECSAPAPKRSRGLWATLEESDVSSDEGSDTTNEVQAL